jgi:hypothetical protein
MANASAGGGIVGRLCVQDFDCTVAQARCTTLSDYNNTCECIWNWALAGDNCNVLTAESAWSFLGRTIELLGNGTICVLSFREARYTWRAGRRRLLTISQGLLSIGSFLVVLDILYAFSVMGSVLRPDLRNEMVAYVFLTGMGTSFLLLGIAVLPALWIEIGLATASMQRMHSQLVITRGILGAILILLTTGVLSICIYVFFDPVDASDYAGYLGTLFLALILVIYRTGVCIIFTAQQRMAGASDGSSVKSRGTVVAVNHLVQVRIAANRVSVLMVLAMLSTGVWLLGRQMESIPLNYLGSSLGLKLCGLCGSAWCILDYSRKTQQRETVNKASGPRGSDGPGGSERPDGSGRVGSERFGSESGSERVSDKSATV